jgi:hypothetical protein
MCKPPLYLLPLALLLICQCACTLGEWHYEEIGRFTSPDAMADAVWVRGGGGATTGFVYELYLVPKGLKFDKDASSFKHSVFSGDHLDDFQIVWREPKLLELHFAHARILGYRNYWSYWNPDSPEVDRHYVIETKLVQSGAGSMLSDTDRQ